MTTIDRAALLGLHSNRFKGNPEERRFAKAWAEQQAAHKTLAYLLDRNQGQKRGPELVCVRDQIVAATLIQWLGSESGRGFLRELGYEKRPEGGSRQKCEERAR